MYDKELISDLNRSERKFERLSLPEAIQILEKIRCAILNSLYGWGTELFRLT
jgi:hypothetical protein